MLVDETNNIFMVKINKVSAGLFDVPNGGVTELPLHKYVQDLTPKGEIFVRCAESM